MKSGSEKCTVGEGVFERENVSRVRKAQRREGEIYKELGSISRPAAFYPGDGEFKKYRAAAGSGDGTHVGGIRVE